MNEKIKQLVDELIKSARDFTIEEDQTQVRIWLGNDSDFSLILTNTGKWFLE